MQWRSLHGRVLARIEKHAGVCSVHGGRGRISFTACLGEGEQLRSVLAQGEEEGSSITAFLGVGEQLHNILGGGGEEQLHSVLGGEEQLHSVLWGGKQLHRHF